MAKKLKAKMVKTIISDAVEGACSDLADLGAECREVVDNMPESTQSGPRGEALSASADELESVEAPEVPDWFGATEVEHVMFEPARRGRALSRADRCLQCVETLNRCVGVVHDEQEDADSDKKDALEELASKLQEIIDRAEECEFPGMFG